MLGGEAGEVGRASARRRQPLPRPGFGQRAVKTVGEILGAAGAEVQAVHAVADLLRHAADIADDRRAAVQEASWMTTGEFSHQIEGMTAQSQLSISRGSSSER